MNTETMKLIPYFAGQICPSFSDIDCTIPKEIPVDFGSETFFLQCPDKYVIYDEKDNRVFTLWEVPTV